MDERRVALEQRLQDLRKELETGEARLAQAEAEAAYVRDTLLRLQGAIQVLEEILASEDEPGSG